MVTLPAAGSGHSVLAFDTGRDSIAIELGVPGGGMRVHPGHDLAVVVRSGSGSLIHRPVPDRDASVDFAGPCVVVVPAGTWHSIMLEDGSPPSASFYTRHGATIEPFSVVISRAAEAVVSFANVAVADVLPLDAEVVRPYAASEAAGRDTSPAVSGATGTAGTPGRSSSAARIVPYQEPIDGHVLALDTGVDSVFVMVARSRSANRAPDTVQVHRHDEVDEFIVLDRGEGWLLNGPTPDTIVRIPFQAPCVLVMPAGNYHRVVRTDDEVGGAILVYADRAAEVATWRRIMAAARLAPTTPAVYTGQGGNP